MVFHGLLRSGLTTIILLAILSIKIVTAKDSLTVAHRWKLLDYNWPDDQTRQSFSHYKRENNDPIGIEVAGNRIFITVPRWKEGVAASLSYIYLNDTRDSPLLNPFPSWEAHKFEDGNIPELISVYRIRADRCGRLWVLDTGLEDILGDVKPLAQGSLSVYNLTDDKLIRKYVIPVDKLRETFFTNVAVEDDSCEDTWAYLADSGSPAMIVYSWQRNESWIVEHHYFHPDPTGGNFNVSGLSFQWWDALIGFGLKPKSDGYSTLYFHALSSTKEFYVDTKILRDKDLATKSMESTFHEFKVLGSRGHNGQSAASFFDPISGLLFHAVSIGNYVACWRPGTEYNTENLGHVFADNVTLNLPSDIKIDSQNNIWVISDRLPIFMFSKLDPNDYNFHILTGPVKDAVKDTVCEEKKS